MFQLRTASACRSFPRCPEFERQIRAVGNQAINAPSERPRDVLATLHIPRDDPQPEQLGRGDLRLPHPRELRQPAAAALFSDRSRRGMTYTRTEFVPPPKTAFRIVPRLRQ